MGFHKDNDINKNYVVNVDDDSDNVNDDYNGNNSINKTINIDNNDNV